MRKQELIIFMVVITLVAVLFLVFVLSSLFSQPEPQTPPLSSSRPASSLRPLQNIPNAPISAPSPIPLPSALPQVTEPTKESIISLLPIQTEFANIEYLASSDSFAVTIKKDPYQENKTKIEDWFKDAGLDPSSLEIYWQTYPEVTITQ